MAEKSLGVWGTIVSGVVVAVVVAAGTAVSGYLWPNTEAGAAIVRGVQAMRDGLRAGLAAVWRAITFQVPIPAGGLALTALVFTLVCWWLWVRGARPPAPGLPRELSANERSFLEILAAADGESLAYEVVIRHLNKRRLEVDQLADMLTYRGLITGEARAFGGANVSLTPQGRDYVLSHSLLGSSIGPLRQP